MSGYWRYERYCLLAGKAVGRDRRGKGAEKTKNGKRNRTKAKGEPGVRRSRGDSLSSPGKMSGRITRGVSVLV